MGLGTSQVTPNTCQDGDIPEAGLGTPACEARRVKPKEGRGWGRLESWTGHTTSLGLGSWSLHSKALLHTDLHSPLSLERERPPPLGA